MKSAISMEREKNMRTRIVHEGVLHLEYEIRQIVEVAHQFEALGQEIIWENIGDPVAMGEDVAPWIVDTVQGLIRKNSAWAYCSTRGVEDTRDFLTAEINQRDGVKITQSDILFVNGIADAVDKVYDLVRRDARILTPSPCYPTHSSNEWKRGDYAPLAYHLNPQDNWLPDLDEMRLQIKYNPQIIAISIIHPDNPTGLVYPQKTLLEIVEIARQNGLFIICDEIYAHLVFNGSQVCHLSEVLGDVPGLSLRGISKEYPWPGARCGWIEIYNTHHDTFFSEYVRALVNSKMMEVCSTTLPQMSIPLIMGNSRYKDHLARRATIFGQRANEAYEVLGNIEGLLVNRPQGAFYFTAIFEPGLLNSEQSLPVPNPAVKHKLDTFLHNIPPLCILLDGVSRNLCYTAFRFSL